MLTGHFAAALIANRVEPKISFGTATLAACYQKNNYVAGLGLWNSMPATLIVEGGFWMIAVTLYAPATHPISSRGRLRVLDRRRRDHANLASKYFRAGIDPDPVHAGIGGFIFFSLLVAWACWMNRLRPAQTA